MSSESLKLRQHHRWISIWTACNSAEMKHIKYSGFRNILTQTIQSMQRCFTTHNSVYYNFHVQTERTGPCNKRKGYYCKSNKSVSYYIVTHFIKMDKISWAHSITQIIKKCKFKSSVVSVSKFCKKTIFLKKLNWTFFRNSVDT